MIRLIKAGSGSRGPIRKFGIDLVTMARDRVQECLLFFASLWTYLLRDLISQCFSY